MSQTKQQRSNKPDHNSKITDDEIFDVLSHRRRRYILHYLKLNDDEDEAKLADVAEQVAAWENEKDVDEITGTERKRVYTALQQSHLPKMDNAGVVKFDKNRGTVTPSNLSELDIYLDVVRGRDIPWSEYYTALSAVGVALLVGAWIDAYPLSLLPDIAWGFFIVAALGVSAVSHLYYNRRMKLGKSEKPPEINN
ncbi:MAG: hypothetical protein SXQ77_09790 [Halobacteria archaeon]|nr:hypothetical protein [Halobacteria archaeon]